MAGRKSFTQRCSMRAQPVSGDASSQAINVCMFTQIPDGDEPSFFVRTFLLWLKGFDTMVKSY
jgi:hypothetical protein